MSGMAGDTRLHREFCRICDCGGRLCGTASERAAVALLAELGAEVTGVSPFVMTTAYTGWCAMGASLRGPDGAAHPLHPLLRSAPTPLQGLEAEVIDLGRGTPEEIEAHAREIPGRIAMVRHELMFAPGTIHRRFKIAAAREAGAAGFLIAGPLEGGLVAGSAAGPAETTLPAAGITPETARTLARRSSGHPQVRLSIATREAPAEARNLIFDVPGPASGCVILSAHIDGHDLGESAIDNASGLAVALEAARRAIRRQARWRRGLRLAFFNVEEWALTGSADCVRALTEAERESAALNINLDSVAGGPGLTALTSGFAGLEPFLLRASERSGVSLSLFRPLQRNSDHANFAEAGIPAFRLVAGFGDPSASVRNVLTPADTRDLVRPEELSRAADLASTILISALEASEIETADWRGRSL